MNDKKPNRTKWLLAIAGVIIAPALYLLSYAPFLACFGYAGMLERTPNFYRPAEWIMLQTYDSGIFALWNNTFDVDGTVELQLFFYAQGAEDLSEWHFDIQPR